MEYFEIFGNISEHFEILSGSLGLKCFSVLLTTSKRCGPRNMKVGRMTLVRSTTAKAFACGHGIC